MTYDFTRTGPQIQAIHDTVSDPSTNQGFTNAIGEIVTPKYTDIVYKASVGNSAVDNMIAGLPVNSKIGDVCKTGGTTWRRISESNPSVISDFVPLTNVFSIDFGESYSDLSDGLYQSVLTSGQASFPPGSFSFGSKVDMQPLPATINGSGQATEINIPSSNPDSTAMRFAAVGGGDRKMTKISSISFTSDNEATAIDAQAVFPITLSDIRCYNMGPSAIKYFQVYYGTASDLYLWGSGLDLENVNNYTFNGGDYHGDLSGGFSATDYTHLLNGCDGISFSNLSFEGYENRIMRVVRSKNLNFKKTWFEASTADHCIKSEIVQDMHFDGCYMELSPSPTSSFILVDNTDTVSTLGRSLRSIIEFTGGYLRLSESTSSNFKLVDIIQGSALVLLKNTSIRSGMTIMHHNADLKVENVVLSSMTVDEDLMKFVESMPVADITDGKNNWCLDSEMNDKDMSGGPIVTDVTSGGSSAVITTDPFSDQNGISTKISIPAAETDRLVIQHNATNYGLTTVNMEGETYIFYIRVYCSHNIPIQFRPLGLVYYQDIAEITTKNGKWVDYVIKTNSSQTWASGSSGTQYLRFELENTTGEDVDFYIDRIDFKKVLGDHLLA